MRYEEKNGVGYALPEDRRLMTSSASDNTSPPDWERIDEEIYCPLCNYNLRGLTVARCPEFRHGRNATMLAVCAALAIENCTSFGRWPNGRYVNGWEE
jgi:hypothetical protein